VGSAGSGLRRRGVAARAIGLTGLSSPNLKTVPRFGGITCRQIPPETRDSCAICLVERCVAASSQSRLMRPTVNPPRPPWRVLVTDRSHDGSLTSEAVQGLPTLSVSQEPAPRARSSRAWAVLRKIGKSGASGAATSATAEKPTPQPQGAPSQHGRIYPHPSQRSWEVSQRISVSQLGQGSVKSATSPKVGRPPRGAPQTRRSTTRTSSMRHSSRRNP